MNNPICVHIPVGVPIELRGSEMHVSSVVCAVCGAKYLPVGKDLLPYIAKAVDALPAGAPYIDTVYLDGTRVFPRAEARCLDYI